MTEFPSSGRDSFASSPTPGFLRLDSWPYRLEYAVATVAILAILFVWRLGILDALPPAAIGLTVFWMVWPDLLAFVPIGVASRASHGWPKWGSMVYNIPHSLLVWAVVFGAWSWLSGGLAWPLLGWAAHITTDRAVGYHLRARSS
jgi:hypothetical protein